MGYKVILVGQAFDFASRLRASKRDADVKSSARILSVCTLLKKNGLPREKTLGLFSREQPPCKVIPVGEFLLYAKKRRRFLIAIFKIRRRTRRDHD